MKKHASLQLIVIAIVFWGVWSLRLTGLSYSGILTMLVVCGLAVMFIMMGKES